MCGLDRVTQIKMLSIKPISAANATVIIDCIRMQLQRITVGVPLAKKQKEWQNNFVGSVNDKRLETLKNVSTKHFTMAIAKHTPR
jgi:hypothetical protein